MTEHNELVAVEDGVQLGVIQVATPHDVIVRATSIARELAGIIKAQKLSKRIGQSEHVFVDAWTTMGGMLGVTARQIPEMSRIHEDGTCEEWVELVRVSDETVIGRAKGICSPDEQNWRGKPLYARSSMAATRATGKAFRLSFSWIMVLAGYSATPAEEMDVVEGEFREAQKPAWSDLQVAAVMSGMQSEDRGKSIAFLNMSGLKHDADVEQIAMLCQEYNNGLADGLEKKDALDDAQKKVFANRP